MTYRFVVLVGLLAMLAIAGCDHGGNSAGIAVINSKEILTKCNAGIQASQDIQHDFADRQRALRAQEEAIRKLQQDPGLVDAKSGKKDELQRLVKAYGEASQQFRRDVANAEAVKFKPVVDKINKILAEYAKEHQVVGVQDKNGFAYVDPSIDITAEIIKRVDAAR